MSLEQPGTDDVRDLTETARALMAKSAWDDLAALGSRVPGTLDRGWLSLADSVSFALGQLHRTDEAAALLERAWAVEPTHRRASSLAWLYYSALMRQNRPPRKGEPREERDREADRAAFGRWIREALALEPDSIKDLYRLGIYESQIESRRDVAALRAFLRAVRAYRALPPEVRERRHDLRKPYVRALYGAARSSLRLGRPRDARGFIYTCIREDRDTDHVEPLHKLFLAGKACTELKRWDEAERAFRLALDAKGPPQRDFVFGALAKLELLRGRLEEARAWIDGRVPPHRRSAVLWRLLGDIHARGGRVAEARAAWNAALLKDRAGRHLTLVRLGRLELAAGKPREAERSFEKALEFRRRRYVSDDPAALRGLIQLAELRGDAARLEELRGRLEALERARRKGGRAA